MCSRADQSTSYAVRDFSEQTNTNENIEQKTFVRSQGEKKREQKKNKKRMEPKKTVAAAQ